MKWFFSIDSKNMLLKEVSLQINILAFKREWDAMKHPSLFLRQFITCFLDVRKTSDTVGTDGLLSKLFWELGIRGRMWLAMRDLYTNVTVQVFFTRVIV